MFIVDAATGGSIGASYEFFTGDSGSGTIRWDLSSLTSYTLGLQFQLSAFDTIDGSSGLHLRCPPGGGPVPCPRAGDYHAIRSGAWLVRDPPSARSTLQLMA